MWGRWWRPACYGNSFKVHRNQLKNLKKKPTPRILTLSQCNRYTISVTSVWNCGSALAAVHSGCPSEPGRLVSPCRVSIIWAVVPMLCVTSGTHLPWYWDFVAFDPPRSCMHLPTLFPPGSQSLLCVCESELLSLVYFGVLGFWFFFYTLFLTVCSFFLI